MTDSLIVATFSNIVSIYDDVKAGYRQQNAK